MKTLEVIIKERLGDGFPERRPSQASIIKDVAREYTKQWIDRAAEEADKVWGNEGVHNAAPSILKLKQEIDKD